MHCKIIILTLNDLKDVNKYIFNVKVDTQISTNNCLTIRNISDSSNILKYYLIAFQTCFFFILAPFIPHFKSLFLKVFSPVICYVSKGSSYDPPHSHLSAQLYLINLKNV